MIIFHFIFVILPKESGTSCTICEKIFQGWSMSTLGQNSDIAPPDSGNVVISFATLARYRDANLHPGFRGSWIVNLKCAFILNLCSDQVWLFFYGIYLFRRGFTNHEKINEAFVGEAKGTWKTTHVRWFLSRGELLVSFSGPLLLILPASAVKRKSSRW